MVETSTKSDESQPELLSSAETMHSDLRNTSSDSGKGSDSALSSPEASPTYLPALHHRARSSPEPSPPYHTPVPPFTLVRTSPTGSPTFHSVLHPHMIMAADGPPPAFRQGPLRDSGSPPFHPILHPRMHVRHEPPSPPHAPVSQAPASSPAVSAPGQQQSPEPRLAHPAMPSRSSPPTAYHHTPRTTTSPFQTPHYRPEVTTSRSSPSPSPPSHHHPRVSPISSPDTVVTYYPPAVPDRESTMPAVSTPHGLQTSGGHVLYRPTSIAPSTSPPRLAMNLPPSVRLAGSMENTPQKPLEEQMDAPRSLPGVQYGAPRVLSNAVDIPLPHRRLLCSPEERSQEANKTSVLDKSDSDKSSSHSSPTDSCYGSSPESTDSGVQVTTSSSVNNGTPVAPPTQVPGKRRPGRPRGSTRKYKPSYIECRKREGAEVDQFSLRSFFEAGGRDYNEYLDWLKRRSPQQPKPTGPMMQKPVAPASFTSSLVAVGSAPGGPPPHPPPHPQNPPPHVDRTAPPSASPMPNMRMPHHHAMYPTPPGLSPVLPPQGYRPLFIPRSVAAPCPAESSPPKLIPVSQIQGYPSSMSHPVGCPVPRMAFPTQQQGPHIIPGHGPTMAMEYNALDLSAKKRKSDSHLDEHAIVETHKFLKNAPLPEPEVTRCLTPPLSPPSDSPPSKPPQLIHVMEDSMIEGDRRMDYRDLGVALSSWDVESVVKFVSGVPGCQEYAETFREHRIDGATLPHLSEGHLINFVKMKLGPAIRLRLAIQRL